MWHKVAFFESLVWLDHGLNPCLPDHWQAIYSLGQYVCVCVCVFVYVYVCVWCILYKIITLNFIIVL